MEVVHASHPGIDKRLRAGTRAAGMRAGFQGDHGRGPARLISGLLQRHDLGMRASHGLGGADAHNFPSWGHNDRAYRWVRARGSTDFSTRGHRAQQRCGDGAVL